LRAVIEWNAGNDHAESALLLVGALLWFWFTHGSAREGRDLTLKALASPSGVNLKEARARALNTAGLLSNLLGETVLARQLLEEALSIQRTIDDKTGLAWSLQFLGSVLTHDKEYELADATFQEGLALTRKLGDVHANTFLHFLGDIYLQKGELDRAKKIYEESVNVLRAIGSKSLLAYPLRRLGYLASGKKDIPTASKYFRESLTINVEVGDKRAVAACLASLAALALQMDKPVESARLYGAVESRLESISVNLFYTDQSEVNQYLNQLLDILDGAAFLAAFSEGYEMNEEQAIELAEEICRWEDELASR
jgi:tetratricopeptide (TPR) repeat protein